MRPRLGWLLAAAGVVGGLAGTTTGLCLAAIPLGIVGPARFAWAAACAIAAQSAMTPNRRAGRPADVWARKPLLLAAFAALALQGALYRPRMQSAAS